MGLLDDLSSFFGLNGKGNSFTDMLGSVFSKPKKFTPSDPGYANTAAVGTTTKQARTLLDSMRNLADERCLEPPSYHNYIEYDHRRNFDEYSLRLGDCCFVIPPEFISVKTISSTDSQVGIRQPDSIKTKHGYSRREIVITLYFNGLDQINGYKVKSPMDYDYYVDGLRPLLAQFKCTPFLPVQNEFLNNVNGIFNVALSSINVNTVAGFPECLQVSIVMQEFNATPYIEVPNVFYDEFIDWDLFRFYYQQMLKDSSDHPSKLIALSGDAKSLTGFFDFKVLKTDALTKSNDKDIVEGFEKEMFGANNFTSIVSSNDNVQIVEMNFGLTNILPMLQLSGHATPTMQYLGGMDTVFSISLETTDREVVSKFNDLNTLSQFLARNYREFDGLGFVKIDNELINLSGVN